MGNCAPTRQTRAETEHSLLGMGKGVTRHTHTHREQNTDTSDSV